jgi:DNA-binding transcriptional LysR family regulator
VADLESSAWARRCCCAAGRVVTHRRGQSLIDRARRLLADADEALDDVRRQVAGNGGRVRLGASTGVHRARAAAGAAAAGAAARRHRRAGGGADVGRHLARLAAGTLDLGLVALPQSPVAGVQIQPWRRDPVWAFVPAAWPVPAAVTPAWLAARPLILNDATTRSCRA